MEQDADFFSSYKAVSNKLKKRFLKKPNLAEAREEFHEIAKSLKGSSHYAGFCCLAMARCEQSMLNPAGEAHSLVDAARHFLQADRQFKALSCPNHGEHLSSAKSCYEFAVKNYVTRNLPLAAAALCREMGIYLQASGQYEEALTYHQRCAELSFQNQLLSIKAHKEVMKMKVLVGDHAGALCTGTDVLRQFRPDCGEAPMLGGSAEIMCDCEVTVVLLILYIDPHPLKINQEYSRILQKYTWTDERGDATNSCVSMNDDLFVLLQSFIMACSAKDMTSLGYLQGKMTPFLSPLQCTLMDDVIVSFSRPPGC